MHHATGWQSHSSCVLIGSVPRQYVWPVLSAVLVSQLQLLLLLQSCLWLAFKQPKQRLFTCSAPQTLPSCQHLNPCSASQPLLLRAADVARLYVRAWCFCSQLELLDFHSATKSAWGLQDRSGQSQTGRGFSTTLCFKHRLLLLFT